jgi:hypothetical protein
VDRSKGEIMPNNARFAQFIENHKATLPILPAVHSTNVNNFGKIIDAGILTLSTCPCYNEDILYCFYGKPAYKITRAVEAATRLLGDATVSFVFDLSSLPTPHRSFALDTGASFGHRYDEYLPNGVLMEDFALPVATGSISKFVTAFFGDNKNYFVGRARRDISPAALDRVSESYEAIIQAAVSLNFDDRACTCELQFTEPISMHSARLMTIVVPDRLYDDVEVRKKIKVLGVKPIIYRFRFATPGERTGVIMEKLGDFYQSRGFFDQKKKRL